MCACVWCVRVCVRVCGSKPDVKEVAAVAPGKLRRGEITLGAHLHSNKHKVSRLPVLEHVGRVEVLEIL